MEVCRRVSSPDRKHDQEASIMNQYVRFNTARFLSLVSIVPIEIYVVFQMAENAEYYTILGLSLLLPLFLELLLQSKISQIIDSTPRRKILVFNEVCNTSFLIITAILFVYSRDIRMFLDFGVLISVEIYLFLAYQTYMALAREIVSTGSFGKYNGLSEILGQLPILLGAFVSSIIFLRIGFLGLILIGVALHLSAVHELMKINEKFWAIPSNRGENSLVQSFRYMKNNLRSIFFIFLLNVPFMAIVAGNLLKPIYIASFLQGNASLLAASEGIYALLAMITGFVAPGMMNRLGEMRSVYLFTAIFFIGSVLIPTVPVIPLYLVFQMLHGFGNPGVRIARNSMVMRSTPVEEMGRFNGSVSFLTIISRIMIIGLCIVSLNFLGVRLLLLLMGILVLVSVTFAGFMWNVSHQLKDRFDVRKNALTD